MQSLQPETTQPEPEAPLPFLEWIAELNNQLATAAASAAEQAFGIGCAVSFVPMVIIIGVLFLFGVRHWVSLFMVGIVVAFLAMAWAVFIALQAHRNGPRRHWQDHLRAEIEAGLEARGASRAQLFAEALNLLPEGAPLMHALRGEYD
jgi:hypothetical protein